MQTEEFSLQNGHPVSAPGWVYVWLLNQRVLYVRATWLHPAVRAEAHLNAPTTDPRSLALRAIIGDSPSVPKPRGFRSRGHSQPEGPEAGSHRGLPEP